MIANGSNPEIIYDILDGAEVGTLFIANPKKCENAGKGDHQNDGK